MKRFLLALIISFGSFAAFAQVVKTAVDYKNEGNEAFKVKDYSKALQFYEQSLRKLGNKQKDTSMVFNMAICAFQTKDYDKAQKFLNESIAMNYKKQAALQYKANIYQLTKSDSAYKKALEDALATSPDDSKIKGRLAGFYLKEADVHYSEGTRILKKAAGDVATAKYKVTDEPYMDAVGKAKDEFKKALLIVDKALANDPQNAHAKRLKEAIEQNIKYK